ncbi:MAG TPA: response regulator, partial [Plasticicumulans sp.]|nr:response regulator [Plasticicumulans sp.]
MSHPNLAMDGARILVVDDAPDAIRLIDGLLSPHYRLHVACNGESALRILAGPLPIDLILLDVVMPDLDGYEVCRRLRALPGREDVPVVFLTGNRDPASETAGFAAGATDFVSKPVSAPVLLARVRTH